MSSPAGGSAADGQSDSPMDKTDQKSKSDHADRSAADSHTDKSNGDKTASKRVKPVSKRYTIPKKSKSVKCSDFEEDDMYSIRGLSDMSDHIGSESELNEMSDSFQDDSLQEESDSGSQKIESSEVPSRKRKADFDTDSESDTERFDPLKSENSKDWDLSKGQERYIAKYFKEYLKDSVVKEQILDVTPIPDSCELKGLTLDVDMVDLFPAQVQPGIKQTDNSFRRVQVKLMDVMGPLGKVWSHLDQVKKAGKSTVPLNEVIKLVEQSVLLVGQANVVLNHNRRLHILSRFLRDHKQAADVLSQNKAVLQANTVQLFGRHFYKGLYRKAVGRKHSSEIKKLSFKQRGRSTRTFVNKQSYQGQSSQQHRKPFQKGPSSYRGRGGGHPRGKAANRPKNKDPG